MEQTIMPVGVENFERLRRLGGYYIDKTAILSELLRNPPYKPVLFTRPHHFGKTLTMSMMESFFNIRKDSKEIFEGLAITEQKSICAEWMNQYPTIFFSFQNIICQDFVSTYEMLELEISRLCRNFLFLKESEKCEPSAVDYFLRLIEMEASEAEVKGALSLLIEMLYKHYEKPVILLIDDYDVPMVQAEKQEFDKAMLDVMNGMFGTALRENEALKLTVISGCLPFSDRGIFLGKLYCNSYSVTEAEFCDSFGFTNSEVDKLLMDAGFAEQSESIKKWYGGYTIGQSELCCPWDVMNYITKLQQDKAILPEQLSNNVSYHLLKGLFTKDKQDKLETLLHDKTVFLPILDGLNGDSMEDELWSRLYREGYFTKAEPAAGNIVGLKIPNKKIKNSFEDATIWWIKNNLDTDGQSALMDALWESDTTTASKIISSMLFQAISCEDCHEEFYCIFLSEILKGIDGTTDFNIGKESGKPTIMIKNRKDRSAIIIEVNKAENIHAINKACDEGIVQIITGQYDKRLEEGFQTVLCYSISFYQKTCMVKKLVTEA